LAGFLFTDQPPNEKATIGGEVAKKLPAPLVPPFRFVDQPLVQIGVHRLTHEAG
jgi:hypothetical protein